VKIWLIKAGEPLLTDSGSPRLLRTGLLFRSLSDEHEVTWISECFHHQEKKFRFRKDTIQSWNPHKKIVLLKTLGYRGNIGFGRILDDLHFALKIKRYWRSQPKPHVVVCAYPLVITSFVVSRLCRQDKVPVAIDVRDLWPDIFVLATKGIKRVFGRMLSLFYNPIAKATFQQADALLSITPEILAWAQQKGKRSNRPEDKSFALSSQADEIAPEDAIDALSFWDNLGVLNNDLNFTYVGLLNNKVDLETLIYAFKKIEGTSNTKLIIAGEGDDEGRLRKLAADSKNIVFSGWINKPQIYELLRRSSVAIAPYKNRIDFQKSIPNKVIEYLCFGLPVMASVDGEIKRLIESYSCGRTYTESDSESVINVIHEYEHSEVLITEQSSRCLKIFGEMFEPKKIFRDFEDHLVKLAQSVPGK